MFKPQKQLFVTSRALYGGGDSTSCAGCDPKGPTTNGSEELCRQTSTGDIAESTSNQMMPLGILSADLSSETGSDWRRRRERCAVHLNVTVEQPNPTFVAACKVNLLVGVGAVISTNPIW